MIDPLADTTDLRTGPELHGALLALLPLVGLWHGVGRGVRTADGVEYGYQQRVRFSHAGQPFLAYESLTWLVDDDGETVGPDARESGFWRAGPGPDDVEVALATAAGVSQTLSGRAGDAEWELQSDQVAVTATARQFAGERRFYAVREDQLVYAHEFASLSGDFVPHLNGQLVRAR